MINIKNTNIFDLYLGQKKVESVWLGNIQVYPNIIEPEYFICRYTSNYYNHNAAITSKASYFSSIIDYRGNELIKDGGGAKRRAYGLP